MKLFQNIGSHTEAPYRAVSILALIQAGVIVGGTLFVGIMVKLAGYKSGTMPDEFFKPLALFIRNFGFLLLLLPAAWAALTIYAVRLTTQHWVSTSMFALGFAAVFFGIYHYANLALNPTVF